VARFFLVYNLCTDKFIMQLITVIFIVGITLALIGLLMDNSHPNHPL